MKLVIILGPHAVGKMSVSKKLADLTELRLFPNHMTLKVVRYFFAEDDPKEKRRLNALFRPHIYKGLAINQEEGIIFTYMVGLEEPSEYEYIDSLLDIYKAHDVDTYVVELEADYGKLLETEKQFLPNPPKRDPAFSEELFRTLEAKHKANSADRDTPFENYLKIDNTEMSPEEAANRIKQAFSL